MNCPVVNLPFSIRDRAALLSRFSQRRHARLVRAQNSYGQATLTPGLSGDFNISTLQILDIDNGNSMTII